MVRPRNEEMRSGIADTAFSLFHEVGYTHASYTLLAERCGITRALVQYHWPKKELLAVDSMTRLLGETIKQLGLPNHGTDNPSADAAKLVSIGTHFFSILIEDKGWRQFLLDILKSRELTEQVLAFNARWAFTYIGQEPRDGAFEEVVVSMGGFYELLYYRLKHNKSIDVKPRLEKVVNEFMQTLDYANASEQ
ncbi:TetR/AcrR family transcriptional regulator [Bifidobacterium olomucense]|uniref:TetR family transcriptional regulator n=1 Tax=Bifidobacterium olomucense TaxID=2675324 RepID=A0A7Y0EWP5_9BIFI|nr:TetR/AcrR family transcriptional regulator [Bifidobacterium sp. DSM 109959]NMM97799.1 TetR family transcriptional regulator [Bifidobacterium sp. DSM 109959]